MKMRRRGSAKRLDRIGTRVLTKPEIVAQPRNRAEKRAAARAQRQQQKEHRS